MMSVAQSASHIEPTILCDSIFEDLGALPLDEDCTFNDVPEDMTSVMPTGLTAWALNTPPHTKDGDAFPFPASKAETDVSAYIPGLAWEDTTVEQLDTSIWNTPPQSPPQALDDMDTFNFDLATALLVDGPLTPSMSAPSSPVKPCPSLAKGVTNALLRKRTPGILDNGTKAGKRVRPNMSPTMNGRPARVLAKVATALPRGLSGSSPIPVGSSVESPELKRQTHNVLERKRRNDLKMSYQALRLQLPALCDNERAPTGHILIQAVEYIAQLKKEDAMYAQRLHQLREQNERLRRRRAAAAIGRGVAMPASAPAAPLFS